jgi:hypothetical protein
MTHDQLDFIFPFIVFAYGAMMTFVLNNPVLMRLAADKFPPQLHQQMNAHRYLAIVCLVVGSLWSLQNLWFH